MSVATGGMLNEHISNHRILVVDDDCEVRKVVRMTLTKAGYVVLEAEDGLKAIQALNQGENPRLVDGIIIDIRMPIVNGVEAISYFQQLFRRVPIIVLTSYRDMEMATRLKEKGIVDYLVKPTEKADLLNSVAKAMEKRKHYSK